MLHHLNLACGGSLGFYSLPDESYLTSRTVLGGFWSSGSRSNQSAYSYQRASQFRIRRDSSSPAKRHNC
jgi:hypothetical protein